MLTANWPWRHCSIEGSHLGALQAEVLRGWEAQREREREKEKEGEGEGGGEDDGEVEGGEQ